MALRPPSSDSDNAKPDAAQDILLREVDDAVRQDQMLHVARNYGKPIAAAVVAGLLGLAGFLYWQHYQREQSAALAERYTIAIDKLEAGQAEDARKDLATLAADSSGAAKGAAALTQAGILLGQGKQADAVKAYAAAAVDTSLPQPFRDLALIRQMATAFETTPAAEVVAKLKPLAVPGNPWFGSAGELVGYAYLKQNKPQLAGPLFAAIAKDEKVPRTIRLRTRQLAAQLGVDAVDEVIKSASKDAEAEASAPASAAPVAPSAAAAAPAQ